MDDARFQQALAAFDRANAEDPHRVSVDGQPRPRELVAAEQLYAWVLRLQPDAPEPVLLAARCQHLKRFAIPRSTFPEGRTGYLQWRTRLGRFHADEAEAILRQVGYDDATIAAVRRLNLKQGLKTDPNTQLIEDALCLSFLEHEFAEFAAKHDPDKVVDIVRKTWRKMSERAHDQALKLPLPAEALALVQRALAG